MPPPDTPNSPARVKDWVNLALGVPFSMLVVAFLLAQQAGYIQSPYAKTEDLRKLATAELLGAHTLETARIVQVHNRVLSHNLKILCRVQAKQDPRLLELCDQIEDLPP